MSFKTVSVIGLGYIGLPTAAMFAAHGKQVVGVDVNSEAIETINRGEIHIVEPELDAIVRKAVDKSMLKAVLTPESADAFLIAVPTPFTGDSYQPDVSYIMNAAKAIAPVLKKGDLVILESTSPVGTTEQLAERLAEERADLTFPHSDGESSDIRIAYCPERVLPGQVVRELVSNDRVIGGLTKKCSNYATELYKTFVQGDCVVTNARTAEMVKLTENASRDVGIAFANELSIICDDLDINVWELIKLANRHPRVDILRPGPGVGGHCIAVDPWFIVSKSPEEAKLISTARNINDGKPDWVVEKLNRVIECSNSKKHEITVCCLGVSFKPDIDDFRESPALNVVEKLSKIGLKKLIVCDPFVSQLPGDLQDKCDLMDYSSAISESDIVIALVNHTDFRNNDKPKGIVVIDSCGIWEN